MSDQRGFSFEFVENLEPYRVFTCSHQQASVGLFEWDVECDVEGEKRVFWVHLALSKYLFDQKEQNAYEVLFWVTNAKATQQHRHSSSTLWIQNSEKNNQMNKLISSLGVDEDNASLRLTLQPEIFRKQF